MLLVVVYQLELRPQAKQTESGMGLRRILQEGQPKTNLITGAILGNQISPEGKSASTQSEKVSGAV